MADNLSVTPAPTLPTLRVSWLPQQMQVAWPTNSTGFVLQESFVFGSANWINSTNSVSLVGTDYQVTVPTTNGVRFFRLTRP